MNTTIATTTFVLLVLAPSVFAAPCKIPQSVYRDANGRGFELVFGASIPGVVMSRATATINHPKQNQIHSFSVTQSNGYGSIFLLGINANNKGLEYGDSVRIQVWVGMRDNWVGSIKAWRKNSNADLPCALQV